MVRKIFITLMVALAPLGFTMGFYMGTENGLRSYSVSTQWRLMKLEKELAAVRGELKAREDADEVFASSLAEAHRTLISYEGATNDLRDEVLAWTKLIIKMRNEAKPKKEEKNGG